MCPRRWNLITVINMHHHKSSPGFGEEKKGAFEENI